MSTPTEKKSPSPPPPHPNLHRQGLLNFEKVLSRIESVLPAAISQRRIQNSERKIEQWMNQDAVGENDVSAIEQKFPDIAIVEALFDCVNTMYVDGDSCNVPPSNFSLTPGLTPGECLSTDYPKLVQDYKRVRDKWIRSRTATASSQQSSRSSSVTSSVAARRRERGVTVAKSKFGKSKTNFSREADDVDESSHNNSNLAAAFRNRNDDDDHDDSQHEARSFLAAAQQQQRLLENDAADHQRKLQEYQEIGHQVRSVRDLQQDINAMLGDQQGVLDRTESNVDKSASSVEKGREHLFSAVKISSIGAGFAGGIVGALVGGPAGFVLGAQSGLAIAASMGLGGVVGGVVGKKVSNAAVSGSSDAETDRKDDVAKSKIQNEKIEKEEKK